MICAVSVIGYEDYVPVYFECNCSKEEFNKEVSMAMKVAVNEILSDKDGIDCFIDGDMIQNRIVLMLSKKFKLITIDHEVNLRGVCFYKKDNRPDTIDDETWNSIIDHNKKICGEGSSFFN